MNRTTDWLVRLLPEEAELLDWSSVAPLSATGPTAFTLGGTLKFDQVDLSVEAEIDVVLDHAHWSVASIRLPQDVKWEDSTWNHPDHDVRASTDAKDRIPRIGLMARLNLYLLEAPHLGREHYVSPIHRAGPVDFNAVGTGKLSEALQDALRGI
ncbi:hypothetical protein [Streptomyces sp. WAC06614]|uniref:hypothetical protein n=1 Tax=Streptomyces sp. WAC06614 TaxID=2487416 RepID=UPI000F76B031|nr:hypothetical protein [Streptomyces sp. WAC06614]RSS66128.1 hypothetical protein EF918_29720 [Streptomyces sp. WAC06614]